ncbi:hypothetical protein [Streptomyces sp. Ru71]|uniref:hypothetical protein n=1 Tax=Streptomyces sp. Ru71 TaxID=2080746 RepID=UPI0015E3A051|nr:hypothetical protein [Streptomyces sp. Ru71]
MLDPHTHLVLHRQRISQAEAHRHIAPEPSPQPRRELRARLGWTLVEVGLRLATPGPA